MAVLIVKRGEGKPTHLVLLLQRGKRRSKWYDLHCQCRRARRDGSCLVTDAAFERLRPEARGRVGVRHY